MNEKAVKTAIIKTFITLCLIIALAYIAAWGLKQHNQKMARAQEALITEQPLEPGKIGHPLFIKDDVVFAELAENLKNLSTDPQVYETIGGECIALNLPKEKIVVFANTTYPSS